MVCEAAVIRIVDYVTLNTAYIITANDSVCAFSVMDGFSRRRYR